MLVVIGIVAGLVAVTSSTAAANFIGIATRHGVAVQVAVRV